MNEQYLTRSLRSLVRYCSCHSNIKFISSHHRVPSFSSKRGHVTVKHVLTGRKHGKLGNQTFEVLQPLKRTVHTISLTYFTYWSSSRQLNYFISEILGQNTWFEVSAVFVYRKHRKLSNFGVKVCLTAVELQMFSYQACHVCAQLEHVFSVTCPRLDENDGNILYIHTYKLTYIRISEIKLVLTQETQAGHVLDRN